MEKVILLAHCIHENYIVKYTCILGVTLNWGKKKKYRKTHLDWKTRMMCKDKVTVERGIH